MKLSRSSLAFGIAVLAVLGLAAGAFAEYLLLQPWGGSAPTAPAGTTAIDISMSPSPPGSNLTIVSARAVFVRAGTFPWFNHTSESDDYALVQMSATLENLGPALWYNSGCTPALIATILPTSTAGLKGFNRLVCDSGAGVSRLKSGGRKYMTADVSVTWGDQTDRYPSEFLVTGAGRIDVRLMLVWWTDQTVDNDSDGNIAYFTGSLQVGSSSSWEAWALLGLAVGASALGVIGVVSWYTRRKATGSQEGSAERDSNAELPAAAHTSFRPL